MYLMILVVYRYVYTQWKSSTCFEVHHYYVNLSANVKHENFGKNGLPQGISKFKTTKSGKNLTCVFGHLDLKHFVYSVLAVLQL